MKGSDKYIAETIFGVLLVCGFLLLYNGWDFIPGAHAQRLRIPLLCVLCAAIAIIVWADYLDKSL